MEYQAEPAKAPSATREAKPESSKRFSLAEGVKKSSLGKQPLFFSLPHSFLLKVLQRLTILERLRSEAVSKHWQRLVKESLQLETTFRIKENYSLRLRLNCAELGENIAGLFKRMRNPEKKVTSLTSLDIGPPFCSGGYHFPAFIDRYFPLLENLTSAVFPPFSVLCKNLRSLTVLRIKGKEFTLVLKECATLKSFHADVFVAEDLVEASKKSASNAKKIVENYFVNARCSLESVGICPVAGEHFIPMLVKTFPNLKEFAPANITDHLNFNMLDYSPLRDLGLRALDFSRIYFSAFGTMCLFSQLFMPLEKVTMPIGKSKLSTESKAAAQLEKLRIWWDFANHNNRSFFFHSVAETAMECRNLKILHFFNEEPPTLFMIQGREDDDRCAKLRGLFTPENFPQLEDLQLPCAHLVGEDLRFELPHLKRLSICGCWTHPCNDVSQFVNVAVRKSPLLQCLHVSFFEFDAKFFPRLAKSLMRKPRALDLKVTRLCQFKEYRLLSDMSCCGADRDRSHDKCPDYLAFLEMQAKNSRIRIKLLFDTECRCAANDACPCGVS